MENKIMIPLSPKEGVALLNLVLEEEEFGAGLSEELSRVKRRSKALVEEAGARKGTGCYYLQQSLGGRQKLDFPAPSYYTFGGRRKR